MHVIFSVLCGLYYLLKCSGKFVLFYLLVNLADQGLNQKQDNWCSYGCYYRFGDVECCF